MDSGGPQALTAPALGRTVYEYFIRQAKAHVRKVLSLFDVAMVNRAVVDAALEKDFQDFEDGVTHEAARLYGAEMIITRNPRDFRKSVIPVLSPVELLELISAKRETEQ